MLLTAGSAAAQATRTWVSGVGDDVNPCSRTAPCKTFAGAISKTAAGGEISVLDPGGFGAVTITKSININNDGGEAGILSASVTGITVNAGATDIVNIRGLVIEGAGTGINGIRYLAGGQLHVQDTVIRGHRGGGATGSHGIVVNPSAGNLSLDVLDTVIEDNGTLANASGAGIAILPTGSASVKVTAKRVTSQNNFQGISISGDNSTGPIDVTLVDSEFSRNLNQGVFSVSPNGGDSLVRVTIDRSTMAGNGAHGVQSAGQRSTIRMGRSTSTANGLTGMQSNNSGTMISYGDNFTDGNGSPNAGVTTATPN